MGHIGPERKAIHCNSLIKLIFLNELTALEENLDKNSNWKFLLLC
jgi:hypothetical protein